MDGFKKQIMGVILFSATPTNMYLSLDGELVSSHEAANAKADVEQNDVGVEKMDSNAVQGVDV